MEHLAHQLGFISTFGKSPVMLLLGFSLIILFLIRQEHYKTGVVTALTSIGYFYSYYLKRLFGIPRPQGADPAHYLAFDLFSFPSSHVLFYTTFWGFMIYLTYKYTKEAKLLLHVIRWASIYMIISIGASRVFLGVHRVVDIVAGYLFGLFFLALLIWLDKKLEKVLPKN